MAWTYGGDPGTGTAAQRRDAVRLAIGDTDSNDQQLTDAEVDYFTGLAGDDITDAAIRCCRALVAKYARLVDGSHAGTSGSASQRHEHYKALMLTLESEIADNICPAAGGMSIGEKADNAGDSDLVQPFFERQRDDFPGTDGASVFEEADQ